MSEEPMINVVRAKEALRVRLGDVERERNQLRADLEAARRDVETFGKWQHDEHVQVLELEYELEQSRATEAELRARVERRDAVVEAARSIDPKDRSFAMDDALDTLDTAEQPARAEQGQG